MGVLNLRSLLALPFTVLIQKKNDGKNEKRSKRSSVDTLIRRFGHKKKVIGWAMEVWKPRGISS